MKKRLYTLAQTLYAETVRRYLPRKIASFDRIPVRAVRLFDRTDTFQNHEVPLREAIRRHVSPGDNIVLIGAGYGVSTVEAARATGDGGSVVAFEAGLEQAAIAKETVKINFVDSIATVRDTAVGKVTKIYGDSLTDNVVKPTELPDHDVLVMDCEGAERGIIDSIEYLPSIIIVESHGVFDSPTDQLTSKLENMGYEIESVDPEKPDEDVYIITACRVVSPQ